MGFAFFISLALGFLAARLPRDLRVTCPVPPICAKCNYDLSGSIGANSCPECGLDWFDATTRFRSTGVLHFDQAAMGRALIAWLIFMAYAAATPYLAPLIIATGYWLDGIHNFDFVRVVHAREMQHASPLPLNFLLFTSSTFCVLPILAARRKLVYALLIPIGFAIDAAYWAFIHKG